MKILRIKFLNLNSLPCGDIDLEKGPLSQAGIFAITGPTGAGKSTILDAITLALYGRAARYGVAPNPENMMSRHTGECSAEVLFEVPRGRFISRWDLRRARGKSTGNLQAPKRTIIDAVSEKVLAERLGDADRLIEELTGLDYGRFLRSVLLAQGEFAQFLKASANDRAALLESLTGTEIYSELSVLAYQECAQREQALAIEEEALGRLVLFSEEERAAKIANIACLAGELTRLDAERLALGQRIDQGRQLAGLLIAETEVAGKQTALRVEAAQAAPELDRLAAHRSAQPFIPFLQTLEDMIARAASESQQFTTARDLVAAAKTRLAAGVKAAELLGAEFVVGADQAFNRAKEEHQTLTARLQKMDAWMLAHGIDRELDAALTGLIERLTGLAAIRNTHAKAQADAGALTADRNRVGAHLGELQTQLTQAAQAEKEARIAATQAFEALNGLLKGRTPEAVQVGLSDLERQGTALRELQIAMEKRDAIVAEGLKISGDETRLVQEIEEARIQKTAAEAEADSQAALLELTAANLTLLERIATYEDQRTQLKPGEACPLCGGLDHPFADPDARPSAAIEEARRNLARAKTADQTARTEAKIAAAHLVRSEETLRQLEKRRGELRTEQMVAHEEFEKHARAVRLFTPEALEEAIAANKQARADGEALTRAVREAEDRKNKTGLAHVQQQAVTSRTQETLAGEQNTLTRLDQQLAKAADELQRLENQTAAYTDELATALEPFGINVPEAGSEKKIRLNLETRHREFQANASERARTDSESKQMQVRIETLEKQAADVRKSVGRLADAHRDVAPELSKADAVLVAQLRKEWKTPEDAETALQSLRLALTEKTAAAEERQKDLQGVQKAVEQQAAQLQEQLSGSPFAEVDALRAARLDEPGAARLEQLKRDLEARDQTLAGQLDQVRSQAELLRQAQAPEGDALAELELARKAVENQASVLADQRTTVRNELDQDDRNRARKSDEAAALDEKRERLAIWKRLRDLIGSYDGAKFRRFAQGLSLDVLIRHANRHLRRLSERYQLGRMGGEELMLEIVDLHQANVRRPMLSLSGGESFLASLALALGLSDLAGRNVRIDSLFIDEGFGSLDAETLDLAVAALDTLRLNNKTVGIISHVELLKERIPVQIRVEKLAGGLSVLRVPGLASPAL